MHSPDTGFLRATILGVDGSLDQTVLPTDEAKRLRAIQDAVGGFIEVIPVPGHRYLIACETAKIGPHVINRIATEMALEAESIQPTDYLAGTVMLVSQRALA